MKEEKTFNPVLDYLNDVLEVFPDDDQLEDIIGLALKQDAYESNKGYLFKRIDHNEREKAFYEQWLKENKPQAGVGGGHGILQDLFMENAPGGFVSKKWILEINNRDRFVAATVIQWLGSNVGMAFLHEALRRFGAHIEYKKQQP